MDKATHILFLKRLVRRALREVHISSCRIKSIKQIKMDLIDARSGNILPDYLAVRVTFKGFPGCVNVMTFEKHVTVDSYPDESRILDGTGLPAGSWRTSLEDPHSFEDIGYDIVKRLGLQTICYNAKAT